MSSTPTDDISGKKVDLEIRELVAYTLHSVAIGRENSQQNQDPAADAGAVWRSSTSIRDERRAEADAIMRALEEFGFSFKRPSAKQMEAALERIMTIPASLAYELRP